ncbi:MAG: hypothetical protein R3F24_06500 [Gammaproteobacteria bacterium]
MKIMPCLEFDGQCAEAFAFYARLLGGRIEGAATLLPCQSP